MQAPLQIAFEGVDRSNIIEAQILEEFHKLEHGDEHLTSARVVVAKPGRRRYTGDPNLVRIHLKVPGSADIYVNHDPGLGKSRNDMSVAISDAFRAALRGPEDAIHKQ